MILYYSIVPGTMHVEQTQQSSCCNYLSRAVGGGITATMEAIEFTREIWS